MAAPYEVAFEVAGPAAMFTRPDTGATPTSYPVPTPSAAKGLFEAVARLETAYIRPTRIDVCQPIRFERYTTNYGGPLRKSKQIVDSDSYQLIATILVDVCYKVYGVVEEFSTSPGAWEHRHYLQDRFHRRLKRGQTWYTPCLGWKEFVPSYFGPLRDETRPDSDVNLVIPSLLNSVFDQPVKGKVRPAYLQNVRVEGGVMRFAQ